MLRFCLINLATSGMPSNQHQFQIQMQDHKKLAGVKRMFMMRVYSEIFSTLNFMFMLRHGLHKLKCKLNKLKNIYEIYFA